MLPAEDVLRGVEKHDDAHIENYINLSEKRISSLNQFALIAALVAGGAVAELSSFDPKTWHSITRSYVYILLMAFSVSVSTYCSVVVVMTLAAASRLQVTDNRLKKRTVEELYKEYQQPGTLLNHLKENQYGWTIFLDEPGGVRLINFPVSLRWISEKYEELRPYMELFPTSTAAFILALLLRVLEKVESPQLKGILAALVLPMLWLTFLHSRRANEITFFHIGLKHESNRSKLHTERTHLLEDSSSRLLDDSSGVGSSGVGV
jgi:hypothetical protein